MNEIMGIPKKNSYRFQGVILPNEWDEYGKPTAVMLSDFDECEYLIERDNPYTGELLRLVNRIVTMYGCSISRENGKKFITFKSYSLL